MLEGKPSPYTKDFNTIKIVFFMETSPMSDKFEQIMLTEESEKRVLDALHKEMPPCTECKNCGGFKVFTNDDHHYTFKDIKSCYSQKKLDEEDKQTLHL